MEIKDFFKLMMVMILVSVGVGMTSCSDSDNPIVATVNNGEMTVAINRMGGTVEIPVESNGDWHVSLQNLKNDDVTWAGIVGDSKSKGPGKIIVAVDYLSPKKQIQERTADIVLECGGKSQTLKLRQYAGLEEGETAVNDDNAFSDVWNNKGIGSGFDITKGEQSENMVVNVTGLIDLANSDVKYKTLFSEVNTAKDKIQVALSDSLENDTSRLSVESTINIKYAAFKLNVKVNYDNKGLLVQNAKTYNAEQAVTFKSCSFDLMSVGTILKKNRDVAERIVSPGFMGAYDDIMEAFDENDSKSIEEAVKALYDSYGPVVVTGADLGGSIFFSMRYDSIAQENNFKVAGKVTAEVPLGPVKIDGGVKVEYEKAGLDIWNNSQHYISASGGDGATLSKLTALMTEQTPNLALIQDAGQAWIKAITCEGKATDNSAVIRVKYQGIWNLFPLKFRRKMKEIAVNYYKDKPLCVKLSSIGLDEKDYQ